MEKMVGSHAGSDVTIIFQALSTMKAPAARFAYVIAFVALAGYALLALNGPRGIGALLEKQAEIHQLEKRNAALAKQIERKREHLNRLNENPAEQELEIRDRLKLVRPNEKVYVTGEPKQ
jgi:cell division protein FtsB